MSYLSDLKTRRAAIAAELAALNQAAAGGKPNATGGGNMVDHTGYKQSLYRELEAIDNALQRSGEVSAAEDTAANGPWEIEQELD